MLDSFTSTVILFGAAWFPEYETPERRWHRLIRREAASSESLCGAGSWSMGCDCRRCFRSSPTITTAGYTPRCQLSTQRAGTIPFLIFPLRHLHAPSEPRSDFGFQTETGSQGGGAPSCPTDKGMELNPLAAGRLRGHQPRVRGQRDSNSSCSGCPATAGTQSTPLCAKGCSQAFLHEM